MDLAIRRILLIYSVILTLGGIPLIYLGDEVGVLNDYGYRNDPSKAADSRWVHRPVYDWKKFERRSNPESVEGKIFSGIRRLISIRKETPAFGGINLQSIHTDDKHVLGFVRYTDTKRVLVFANFSESEQRISSNLLRVYGHSYRFRNLINGDHIDLVDIILEPFGLCCLESEGSAELPSFEKQDT